MKEKAGNLDIIKIKNFCFVKDTIKIVQREVTEWEKNICKNVSDKGLVFKTYKNT